MENAIGYWMLFVGMGYVLIVVVSALRERRVPHTAFTFSVGACFGALPVLAYDVLGEGAVALVLCGVALIGLAALGHVLINHMRRSK